MSHPNQLVWRGTQSGTDLALNTSSGVINMYNESRRSAYQIIIAMMIFRVKYNMAFHREVDPAGREHFHLRWNRRRP